MSFIETIKTRAKSNRKTIVLPEATDLRVLEATSIVLEEDFANIILIGNEKEIRQKAQEHHLSIEKAQIEDPNHSSFYDYFVEEFYELRKHKGMAIEEAKKQMMNPVFFGMMMVRTNKLNADGLVSGAIHSTADTLRPALQILKTAKGTKLVSAFFIMVVPNCNYGENGTLLFGDCGLNENPGSIALAEIAMSSSRSFQQLIGGDPCVGMLSYSTHGSAKSDSTQKVIDATKIVKGKMPELKIDGELQLDAAIIPEIASFKAPKSEVEGKANILIFPDLDAGNIGYKLVQRFAKAEAYGPLCQGIAKPVNDLSRGCSAKDIVGVVGITAVQAQQND